MKSLAHLQTRIFGVPLAIQQSKLDVILSVFDKYLNGEITATQIEAAARATKSQSRGYAVKNGIAVIPVMDSLMKKTSGLMPESGASSYEQIGAQYMDAMNSKDIKGILLDIDSPGGETSGLFELCQAMSALKGKKPVYAISNDGAYSAAYAIACVADKLFVTLTGGVGSIGVICAHKDVTKADEMAGHKYTFIHAGTKKADGNPHVALSEDAIADTQAEVDRLYSMFVQLVASNRGISTDAVIDTQAGVCFGELACPLLADAVGTFEDAFNALSAEINTKQSAKKAMPAIPPHKTATVKTSWDVGKNTKNLKEGGHPAYYEKGFAFRKTDGDPTTKSDYSFLHHEVSETGAIGAANLKACSAGIAILNGAHGQTLNNYTASDIKGIYAHLAAHLKDAGQEAPPLKAEVEEDEDLMAKKQLTIDEEIELLAKAEDDEEMKDCDSEDDKKKPSDDDDDDPDDDDEDDDDDDDDDKKEDKKSKSKSKASSDAVQIANLCAMQGRSDLTAKFLGAGKSLSQVTEMLMKLRKAKTSGVKVDSGSGHTTDAATKFREAFNAFSTDDKPNKAERFAAFIGNHRAEYDAYNKARKGAKRSADVI